MLFNLILLFTCVPLVELLLLIKVGGAIGAIETVTIVLATGVIGALLAKWQGTSTWYTIQRELASGRLPAASMFDGVLIFAAGLLLLTPGFLTDIVGFLLLIPQARAGMRNWLKRQAEAHMHQGTFHTQYTVIKDADED